MQIFVFLSVLFSLLAAWAWAKSAILSKKIQSAPYFLDDWMNKISTDPSTWNAIAAFLAAAAAICQALNYVTQNSAHR